MDSERGGTGIWLFMVLDSISDSEELYENDDLLGLRSDIQHERESR